MTTPTIPERQLTACFGLDRHGEPMAVIDGLPGEAANMGAERMERLARQFKQIAIDTRMGVRGVRHYPEKES